MAQYVFRSAVFENEVRKRFRLERAESDFDGSKRTPWRLRLTGRGSKPVVVEMTRQEAYAFSEWLDGAVTEDGPV